MNANLKLLIHVHSRPSFQRSGKTIYRARPLASFSSVAWRDHPFVQPATERDQLNVLADIQRAQARGTYLERSFWPVRSFVGKAHELLAYKLGSGEWEAGGWNTDLDEKGRNGVQDS
jgi:hypothetical protein